VVPAPVAPAPGNDTGGLPIADSAASDVLAPADAKSEVVLGRRKLQLSFTGECWAEIYDARGWRLFFGFGHAGTAQELNGVPPFRLVLGNTEAITVAIEGNTVSLPAGVPNQRVRILVSADGVATALP